MWHWDGRFWWFWDGVDWRVPIAPRQERPDMFWFFRAPDWIGPVLLMGLIALIPIAGVMVMTGWYLAARDSLRLGYWLVPRASFDYLGRGAGIFVVQFVYGLVLLPILAVFVVALIVAVGLNASGLAYVGIVLASIAVWLGVTVVISYATAAIIAVSDRYGIGAGLNPARVWRAANANSGASWRRFGAYLLGVLIAVAIGLVVPFGASLLLPAAFLMGAPAQAAFDETAAA
jgi:hypothetical protein